MIEMSTQPRRRWFQFSLGELLILPALLAVMYWQATQVPTTYIFHHRHFGTEWEAVIEDKPDGEMIAIRCVIGTVGLLAMWLVGRAVIRRCRRPTHF